MPPPWQDPNGETFDGRDAAVARFLSDPDALTALRPQGFALNDAPAGTIQHTILHDLAWLAGRSYSMRGVKLLVRFHGADEHLTAPLPTVLWEPRAAVRRRHPPVPRQ